MLSSERRAEPRAAATMVQGAMIEGPLRRLRCAMLVPPVLALLLSGCSTLDAVNPVHIYHSIVGGEVAKDRPPLPGSEQGDPNLASVPPKPAVKPVRITGTTFLEFAGPAQTPLVNIAPRPCVFHACRRSIDAARSRTARSNSLSTTSVTPFLRTWSFRWDRNATSSSGMLH